ncbi:MAG: S-methyl-5'-thioinosine phosphorylase [Betaproteobacteria bacterium]|nr:S-methyl-5'-thioinosine phosphorylase [Betaproteobacteria bacterium]
MDAIIGGSQLTRLAILDGARRERVSTPYGEPSGPISVGAIAGREVAFLPRHGDPHAVAPHLINYRANIWALRSLGVTSVIAIGTSGGMREGFGPGAIIVPDQIIDYTWGRAHTFSDGDAGPVVHVDFTLPFTQALRDRLLAAAAGAGVSVFDGGCYACFNGPRLETAAEIRSFVRAGCDLVGQTLMPEAGLAREAGLAYAALCPIVNHAAGMGASKDGIVRAELTATRAAAMEDVMRILARLVEGAAGG